MSASRKVLLLMDKARAADRAMLRGIFQYSRIHDPWKFYRKLPTYRDVPKQKNHSNQVDLEGIQGIVAILHESHDHLIRQVRQSRLPMIVVPIREFIEAVPNIFDEKGTIGKMAADYLLDLGFRHFAYCGFENICWSQDRCEGFCRALQKAGYQVVVYPEPPGSAALSWEKESAFMIQWLRSLPKPVGVMACNDERGQLVIDACSHAGLLVPEQVAVIGVDNDDLICELAEIPLSSIAMNFEKVGYEIASLLDQMMSGKSIEEHQFILRPTHVVARQSTDVVAIEDQDVAEAVRFIRNHAQEPIHVVDVMNVVPLARRTLEMKFRKILGRTIYEEITRVRMDHVSRMLTETDLSISQIAQSMEYTNLSPIWRSFRKEKGMTPMEYRGLHSVK